MTSPNPVRTLDSLGVRDQTADAIFGCDKMGIQHQMYSIKTNSELVRYVEQCEVCGWIDGASLNWWAEDAMKKTLSRRAERIAVATDTKPFKFVQSSEQDLTLQEILAQALGTASTCWVGGTGELEFDSARAREIYQALLAEVQRAIRIGPKEDTE